jgi:predicted alpha-1,2-mannosidase
VLLSSCSDKDKGPVYLEVEDPLAYASPLMGSGGYSFAAGSAWPGACSPNGMMKVGPDTSGPYGVFLPLHYSGYWPGDDRVLAFSHMHLHGTGARDFGFLGLLPIPAFDPSKLRVENYETAFDKLSEVATPGYYASTLENGGIRAEFTADTHTAHERFTFSPDSATGTILIDTKKSLATDVPEAEITLDAGAMVIRGRLKSSGGMSGGTEVFFVARFNKAWTSHHVWANGSAPASGSSIQGTGSAVELTFDVSDRQPVELQLALSLVSAEGAQANLAAEMASWDFGANRAKAEEAWRGRLRAFRVFGGTEEERKLFYSAFHHAFVMPSIYSDVDGQYRFDSTVAKAEGFHFVNDLSLWDSYRTLHPLYSLVARDRALDSVQSLYAMAKVRGAYPKWPLAATESGTMVGASADVVLADAYLKGIRDFDAKAAYALARRSALDPSSDVPRGGRDSWQTYITKGYVAKEDNGRSVSVTTEYATNDFALANLAEALGESADAQALHERSLGYRKLWDPATKLLRPHTAAGQLWENPSKPFDPASWDDFVEANAYQSVWAAPHDVDGLASLFGGREAFVEALSDFFAKSKVEREEHEREAKAQSGGDPTTFLKNMPPTYYWAGNEPDIQLVYMFAQAGRPDLTQQWLPWVLNTYFNSTPEGLPGNDDGGTMSAWIVFSYLGIYPLPGSDRYIVGTPRFPKVQIEVSGGLFTVEAKGVSEKNIYVQSATLNGAPLAVAELKHADLKAGGSLTFEMGPNPSNWARK